MGRDPEQAGRWTAHRGLIGLAAGVALGFGISVLTGSNQPTLHDETGTVRAVASDRSELAVHVDGGSTLGFDLGSVPKVKELTFGDHVSLGYVTLPNGTQVLLSVELRAERPSAP